MEPVKEGSPAKGGSVARSWNTRCTKELGLLVLLLATYLAVFIATISDYGITWDSALGELYLGDKYLHFFQTLDPAGLDFDVDDVPVHRRADHPDFFATAGFARKNPEHVWGLGPTLSALTKYVFYTRLALLDPVDAHHLAGGLQMTVLLAVIAVFARRHFGFWPAVIAGSSLALHPRLWAHAHNNPKDVPLVVLFSLAAITLYSGVARRRPRRIVAAAILWGAALAAKASALVVPLLAAPAVLGALRGRPATEPPPESHGSRWSVAAALAAMPLIAFATALALWPYLATDFPRHLMQHVQWLLTRSTGGSPNWTTDAVGNLLITTPIPILAMAAVGFVALAGRWRRRPDERGLHLMILAWLALPILRVSVPHSRDYDGIRHWMEVLPALAVLAGLGGGLLIDCNRWAGRWRGGVAVVLLLGAFGPILAWNVLHHPDQLLYFNAVTGGLAGARERGNPDANDYWGSSYRRGLAWINENAGPDSLLIVGVGEHIVAAVAEIRLREDVQLLPVREAVERLASRTPIGRPDQAVYLMYITRPAFYTDLARLAEEGLQPIHEITADGVPILKIFRLK